MESFSDYYQASYESVGISGPISDSQDKISQSSVSNHLSDRQYLQFAPVDILTSSGTCETITKQAMNRRAISSSFGANKAPLYLYESTTDSLGLQETINSTLINNEQVAAAAIYGPSVGVDHGDWAVYPTPKSTGREEINDCEDAQPLFSTPGNGSGIGVLLAKNNTACWRMKKRKTDCGSVLETNLPVLLKKPKRDRCKSSPTSSVSKDKEKNLNSKSDVIRRDPPELLSSIVQEEQKAESHKDYIHVRVRRGQATDSHSLAERVRRKKISDRMNVLQNLLPGCHKVTSKALLLEEIINYVQSLKSQVEILSRKLAYIAPICAFDHQNTGHLSQELLPLQAIPDPTIAYGTAHNYADHPDKVP